MGLLEGLGEMVVRRGRDAVAAVAPAVGVRGWIGGRGGDNWCGRSRRISC